MSDKEERERRKKKKKQKQLILIVIMVLVIGGLAAGIAKLSQKKDELDETTAPVEEKYLVSLDSTAVTKLSCKKETEELTFVKTDDGWQIVGHEDMDVNQTRVETFVKDAVSLKVKRVITEDLSTAADYGLADPKTSVTITTDKETVTVLLGSENPSSKDLYAKTENGTEIVTIDNTLTIDTAHELMDYLKYESLPAVATTDLREFRVTQNGKTYTYVYDPSDLKLSEAMGVCMWFLKTENGYEPTNSSVINTYLNALVSVPFAKIHTYKATEAERESCGFTGEETRIDVKYAKLVMAEDGSSNTEEEHYYVLHFGNTTEEGQLVSLDNSTSIYVSELSSTENLTKDVYWYLHQISPLQISITNVSEVSFSGEGMDHTLTIEHRTEKAEDGTETTKEYLFLDGKAVSEDSGKNVYKELIKVYADHFLTEGIDEKDPEICFTIRFLLNSDEKPEVVAEFTKLDNVYYGLSVNGRMEYAVTAILYEKMLGSLQKYLTEIEPLT